MNGFTKFAAVGVGSILVVSSAGAVSAATYPPTPVEITCSAKAVSNASKIKVNMGPNLAGNAYYVFRIDKKVQGEWVRALKQYKTQGKGETRTVNVKKGTYRIKCYPETFPVYTGTGLGGTTSNTVKIKR